VQSSLHAFLGAARAEVVELFLGVQPVLVVIRHLHAGGGGGGGSGVKFFPSRDSRTVVVVVLVSHWYGCRACRLPRRRLQDPGPAWSAAWLPGDGIRGDSATRLLARFAAQRWRSLRQPLLCRACAWTAFCRRPPFCKTRSIITLQARATACGRNYLESSCAGVRFALGMLQL
jgi:hypothetical protein